MKTSYELPFRLFGIPIKLNISFIIFLPVLAWIIGNQIDFYVDLLNLQVDTTALTSGLSPYWIGLISAIGLFACVTLHEIGHSLVALSYGVNIQSITLYVLGGVAQLEEIPEAPGQEAKMAVAGPLTSLLLSGLSWGVFVLIGPVAPVPKFVLGYLVIVNLAVALFNLLPALPLDGGRILRSVLALYRPRVEATKLAGNISKVLAIAMGLYGLINFNIFLLVIAFYIYSSMSAELRSMVVHDALGEMRVGDLMTEDVVTIGPEDTVSDLLNIMLERRHLGYPVTDEFGNVLGIVTLEDLQGEADEEVKVKDLMTSEVVSIQEDQGAEEAFNMITENDFGRLVVVDRHGKMVGIVSRTDIMNALKIISVGRTEA